MSGSVENLGTVCISVPQSKFWGLVPLSTVITPMLCTQKLVDCSVFASICQSAVSLPNRPLASVVRVEQYVICVCVSR